MCSVNGYTVRRPCGIGRSNGSPSTYHASLVIPTVTLTEIAVLKGIAAHYVMRADDRVALMERQRGLLTELVAALSARPELLDPMYAEDHAAASDDAARLRVVLDQVASLTDPSAVEWHARFS